MAKLYSIRELELNSGVEPETFEQFVREEWACLPPFPGLRQRILRGERGVRAGKYLFVMEWDSIERWLEVVPREGQSSEEFRQWRQQDASEGFSRFLELVSVPGGAATSYTAYVDISEP
jgi:hypothetical protein